VSDPETIVARFHDEFDAMLAVALELDDPHPMEDSPAKWMRLKLGRMGSTLSTPGGTSLPHLRCQLRSEPLADKSA